MPVHEQISYSVYRRQGRRWYIWVHDFKGTWFIIPIGNMNIMKNGLERQDVYLYGRLITNTALYAETEEFT